MKTEQLQYFRLIDGKSGAEKTLLTEHLSSNGQGFFFTGRGISNK